MVKHEGLGRPESEPRECGILAPETQNSTPAGVSVGIRSPFNLFNTGQCDDLPVNPCNVPTPLSVD